MKVCLVCWPEQDLTREERREALVVGAAEALFEAGVRGLTVYVSDQDATVRSPSPFPLFGDRAVALVEVWADQAELVDDAVRIVADAGFAVHAYRVHASIYRDYGDNAHARPRDWPDGERSPGVVSVNLLERPPSMSHDAWVERWFSTISPISEQIQPRTRYVRNVVEQALTPGAPAFEGIVIEAWPSAEHVTDPFLFYGAGNVIELARNMTAILKAVASFTRVWRVQTVMASEWILRTPDEEKAGTEP